MANKYYLLKKSLHIKYISEVLRRGLCITIIFQKWKVAFDLLIPFVGKINFSNCFKVSRKYLPALDRSKYTMYVLHGEIKALMLVFRYIKLACLCSLRIWASILKALYVVLIFISKHPACDICLSYLEIDHLRRFNKQSRLTSKSSHWRL